MKDLLQRITELVQAENVRISEHGYDELAEDGLSARGIVSSIINAELIEEYPDYPKGPCLLVLQNHPKGEPIHVVWGIPKGYNEPAVLVTAYRPDPKRWEGDFKKRK